MKIRKFCIIGALFTFVFGTALHFVYEAAGENVIAGLFAPVNESVWEHMKMIWVPFLLCSIWGYFNGGRFVKNYIFVQFLAVVIGIVTTMSFFYTYSGVIGRNVLVMDIVSFALGVAAAFYFSFKNLQTGRFSSEAWAAAGAIGFAALAACFVCFTFSPPHIPLFMGPDGTYGIL